MPSTVLLRDCIFAEFCIYCHKCHLKKVAANSLSEYSAGKYLEELGWRIIEEHPLCPKCVKECEK